MYYYLKHLCLLCKHSLTHCLVWISHPIDFSVVLRKDNRRVICWTRLCLFTVAAGLGFGGSFELLRWLVDGVWSARSLACETALIGVGAAVFLLSDGLLKPIERLFPVEKDVNGGYDELEPVKTQVIPGLKVGED